ncbi:DUF1214 domain-containing protein [Leifsonia sp. L25]|uniref:DUF1214 domain-containing protein n=1 Tax=Actinomycetes TaxID=1760 RepID=UPI003D687295
MVGRFRRRPGCDHRRDVRIRDHGPAAERRGEVRNDDRERLAGDPPCRPSRKRAAGPRRTAEGPAGRQQLRGGRVLERQHRCHRLAAQRGPWLSGAFRGRRSSPNGAFWSLTATDPTGYIVETRGGRSSLGSQSGLRAEPDGSLEILLQAQRPPDAALNWLATPPGRFSLMLRAYLPGRAILDGDYQLPPVVEVRS